MTKIHHATANRAAKYNISLTATDTGEFSADTGEIAMIHADAKVALNHAILKQRFGAEYPVVEIAFGSTYVTQGDEQITLFEFDEADFDVDDVFVGTLEAAQDEGINLEGTNEPEEESAGGNVVSAHYQQLYKERGNAAHCGDWLAKQLEQQFDKVVDSKLSFDWEAFEAMMVANECPMVGKWTKLPESGQKGWVGRYRMNGRLVLEKVVALRGTLILKGATIEVPEEELAVLKAKHPTKEEIKARKQAAKELAKANKEAAKEA